MSVTDLRYWNYPTRMVFGVGAIARLPRLCTGQGMNNPLLVTDEGLKDMAIVTDTVALLKEGGVSVDVFAGVKGNPTGSNVEAGLKVFKQGGHDGVIAFGGGSGIDAGKAIAFMAGQDRPIWDFEDAGSNWRRAKLENVAPVIAVPTTSGTGSEVGRASIISNEETKEKKIIFHPCMMPGIALCDPELTRGLPAHLTAATGFDAFVHCFEAYCAPGYHPMADGIALEGMRLAARHLPKAVRDGGDMEARTHMMCVAAMGATAFQKGLGGVHALSHTIGAMYDTHHGLTNAVVMPYVVRANRPAIEDQMARIGRALDLEHQNFDGVFDWLLKFRAEVNIVNTLADMKVPDGDADEIGARSVKDPCAGGNPIQHEPETYAEIFRKAHTGDLS
ncbi:MAG TPA: iron-containing alcohol dehydrogenase [Rhizobiales bacterium]|nr:1,3-propanediol dehydrogenase [bacterium BMS3Bbin10]HDO51356.1 iron-containing alcohol dehydrogenase [Hyphomicrobiales bacterium]